MERTKCCFFSVIGRIEDSRISAIAAALETAFGPIVTIMPGASIRGGRHVELPLITAFFSRDGGTVALIRAIWQRLRNGRVLLRELIKAKPSLCICIEPDSWLIAVVARWLYGAAVAVDIQEYYPDRAYAFPKAIQRPTYRAIQRLMKFLARRTDLIIHVSPERDRLYDWLPAEKKTFYMLYPEPDLVPAQRVHAEADCDRVLVAHAGPVRPSYAGFELLQAMTWVQKHVPNCTLRVWGGFFGMRGVTNQIVDLIDSGIVTVENRISADLLLATLPSCDIGLCLVLPIDETHIYAQPRKLYEYMAAGLPVIGSDVPTIRRVVEQYHCGVLVDARDPKSIAEAIIGLSRDPELRKELGTNGRRAVREHFKASAERERLVGCLRLLLNGTGA